MADTISIQTCWCAGAARRGEEWVPVHAALNLALAKEIGGIEHGSVIDRLLAQARLPATRPSMMLVCHMERRQGRR